MSRLNPSGPDQLLSGGQLERYRESGYVLLERVIPDAQLEVLRSECARVMRRIDVEIAAGNTDAHSLSRPGSRYFISQVARDSEPLREFLLSPLMRGICRSTLGDEAYFFLDQFVVKAADVGGRFSWHQDSGFIPFAHRPYLTCWCALDDIDERNGTIYVLPYDRAGTRERVEHLRDEQSNDLVGYSGDDPGEPIIAPAGSIAAFSSTVLHRSGPNTTDRLRRVYLAQYSAQPIRNPDGSLRREAVPFPP